MSNLNQTTTVPSGKDIKRKWFVIDATGKTLGRLSTVAASVLAGKLNPLYTPYIDMGDHIIVINAEKIVLTGMKSDQKLYRRYTGFPGGLREESFIKLLARRPEAIVEQSIKGMLPKSKLGRQMATKLKVYKGDSTRTSPSSRSRSSFTRPTPPRLPACPSPASPRTSRPRHHAALEG